MARALGITARTQTSSLVVAMLAAALPAMASPPLVACPKLDRAPSVDGTLAPGEWTRASALGPFVLLKQRGMPSLTTQAWVGYTDEGIYIAARLFDPAPMQIHCYATDRDGAVGADDSFHMALRPPGGGGVIHLAVNAAGTMYDALGADASVDFNWAAATGLTDDGWTAELVARFEDTSAKPGDTWGMTCYRNAPRVGEKSAWSALQEGVNEPTNLGEVLFGGPPARCEVSAVDRPWFGDNNASATVYNRSAAEITVKLNARVTGTDRRAHSFTVTKITVPANGHKQTPVPFSVQRGGSAEVQISAQVIEGDKAITFLRTAPMPFKLPALGQALDDALSVIAEAYKVWAQLPAEARPPDSDLDLASLQARWRYLNSQNALQQELTEEQVEALVQRAGALEADAASMLADLKAAGAP